MTDLKTRIYLITSSFGILLGISAAIAFGILHNELAVLWSLISAAYASKNLFLHYLYAREKLEEYYNINVLQNISSFGFISTVIFLSFLTWYIFEICYYMLPLYPLDSSRIIVAVWCFMSVKWTFLLIITSNRYIKILGETGRPLLQV